VNFTCQTTYALSTVTSNTGKPARFLRRIEGAHITGSLVRRQVFHMDITFLLNGESVEVRDASPTVTLLDWLREERGLTGTKEGCNEGDCGACTVMVTDARGSRGLNACILFLPQIEGCAVRTVEGISSPDGDLHPVQEEMIAHHGSQCGFCTPGMVMSAAALLKENPNPTEHEVRVYLEGNLCRCTGYHNIVKAILAAAGAQGEKIAAE